MASPSHLALPELSVPATLLDALGAASIYFRPLYAPGAPAQLIDLAYVQLNAVAQRLLGLPEFPAQTLRTLVPHETALFAFYRDIFLSGEAGCYDLSHPYPDQRGPGWRVAAQRQGALLAVVMTEYASPGPAQLAGAAAAPTAPLGTWQLLQERRTFYQVFAQTPAAICFLREPQHRLAYFNEAFAQLFPGRELRGHRVAEVLPEVVTQGYVALLDQVYQTGGTYHGIEMPLTITLPGSAIAKTTYLSFTFQAYQENGQTVGLSAFGYDVTEQVLARQQVQHLNAELQATNAELRANYDELALAQTELRQLNQELAARVAAGVAEVQRQQQRMTRFFEQAPAAICVLDGPRLVFELVNPAYQERFPGRPLLGLPLVEALPELAAQHIPAQLRGVYDTGLTHTGHAVRLPVARPGDGQLEEEYFNCVYQARHDEHGRIDGVLVFALDVTAQVLAQRRADALQAEVQAAQQRHRQEQEASFTQLLAIFEQAPVALALLQGPDYHIVVANPTICAFWGRERAAVMGQPLFEVLPEVVEQGFADILATVRRTGQAFIADERPVQLHRHGRLETVYFHFVYQPLIEAQGQINSIAIVATDVSSRVLNREQLAQANEELRTTNAQLTRTNADLDNFIYTASHDLKAPIANIESLLVLLRQQLPAAARQAGLVPRVLAMMQGAIERFQLTIVQLTDLSHLQQLNPEPAETVDLAATVEAVRLDLAPMLEAAQAQLVVVVADCGPIRFAPQHLRSVVYNLLSNALKYRHPDRVPQVELRCHTHEHHTVLEVQDNGLGLSADQQTRLFGLFRRLHAHVEGSGVGLYMVKRIVENAGGTVSVHSQLGVGSTFTVVLPA